MDSKHVPVSIIIPVYNVENTLIRCVNSVLRQTLQDIEIILVDDGSLDHSGKICDELASNYSQIKVIHQANKGLGLARNSGIRIAEGKYVAFLDSDDYVDVEMYGKLFNAANQNSASAAFCGRNNVYNEVITSKVGMTKFTKWSGKSEIKQFLMKQIAAAPEIKNDSELGATVTNAIYLNSLLQKNNIRFESEKLYVSEDGLFDIDFCSYAQIIVMIPDHYYYYDYNPDSLTTSYDEKHFEKTKRLFEVGQKKLLEGFKDSAILFQYRRMFISASRVCIIQEARHCSLTNFFETRRNIKHICHDKALQDILMQYPWQKFHFKKKIFAFFTRYKLISLQILIVKIAWFIRKYGR